MFRVSCWNDSGSSESLQSSDPVTIRSSADTPSAPRGPLELSGMTDTSLTLRWIEPETDGGSAITEYLVERRESGKKAWQKVGTVDGRTTHIESVGLKMGTTYTFRITAQNQLGYGPPFEPEDAIVAGKRMTAPSPPSNLQVPDVTSRSVTLQWAPPATTGGAELTGYVVERCLIDGSNKWEKVVTLDPSVTVYQLQNLREKSEYYFRVLSENPMGMSAPAETERVALKTHATPPSPPTAPLEVRPVGPNAIKVEWGIPESDGGAAIDGYIVAVRESRKTMWMEVGQVNGVDTTRLIVKDMQVRPSVVIIIIIILFAFHLMSIVVEQLIQSQYVTLFYFSAIMIAHRHPHQQQEGHKYFVRVFARNEVGLSDPLEMEEPVKVVRPPGKQQSHYFLSLFVLIS